MIRPDLHLHTTASDGRLSAWQVARLAQRADVTLFSITDHDTLAALPEAADAAYERGLAFLPGVEISAEGDAEVHILGYGVQAGDPALTRFFQETAQSRISRARQMAGLLADMGLPLPIDEIIGQAGASVGRPHLGRAMAALGYVENTAEAFERYLAVGRPAYLPRKTPSALQAISLLRERGAVPVLAHPGLIAWPMEQFMDHLARWQAAGLRGIEVYHPAHRGHYAQWDALARSRGLLVTGGSDFHEEGGSHGGIGETAAEWPAALQDGWALYHAAQQAASTAYV